MKYLITILILLPLSASAALLIAKSVRLSEDPREVRIEGKHFKTTVPKLKCNEAVITRLKDELASLSAKSVKISGPGSIRVSVSDKEKIISRKSPLGLFVQNFVQKMITLKAEVSLACPKK